MLYLFILFFNSFIEIEENKAVSEKFAEKMTQIVSLLEATYKYLKNGSIRIEVFKVRIQLLLFIIYHSVFFN